MLLEELNQAVKKSLSIHNLFQTVNKKVKFKWYLYSFKGDYELWHVSSDAYDFGHKVVGENIDQWDNKEDTAKVQSVSQQCNYEKSCARDQGGTKTSEAAHHWQQ